jgi:glycosyltransferase involved in cell wall biosynthesis
LKRGGFLLRRRGSSRLGGDRDFVGALVYGSSLASAAFLAYAFNALMGRRLSAADFGTFGALMAFLLALSGPSSALFGGAAMSAARSGEVPRARWLAAVVGAGTASAVAALLPLPMITRATLWILVASAMWIVISWNRGLLIGFGRLPLVAGTIVLEALARLGLAWTLVARGWRVGGAAAGLALGMASAAITSWLLLPRDRGGPARPIRPEVWLAVAGLFFLGMVQFPDVIAIRLINPRRAGGYTAASSIARMVVYAQAPAIAYAIRRAAVAGPERALRRALILGILPGALVLAAVEAFPARILRFTYGARYLEMAGLIRVLAVAMLLSGVTLVLVNVAMGAGRSSWVWWTSTIAIPGTAVIFSLGGRPVPTAFAVLSVQAFLLLAAWAYTRRLTAAGRPAHGEVLIFTWRDTTHPQGGGSEVYVEECARRLAREGRRVTIFCADHGQAPRDEVREGVRFVRRGRWWSVYLWAAVYHLRGAFGPHDVVIDVQNAIPFFTPLFSGRPVVVLVHHVHREQWGMLFGRLVSRVGWWVESRLAPRVYRRCAYVAVSSATKVDLVNLGVDPERIAVVRGGTLADLAHQSTRSEEPTIAYLGRLVPHKRVELLFEAAAALRERFPTLRVRVIGRGGWEGRLRATCEALGLADMVSFEGFVSHSEKLRHLAQAWVVALPSVKEGWGLAVTEAAAMATPSVAFRVGGLQESIIDGETGLLAGTAPEFVSALEALLSSPPLRERMGQAARARSAMFSWDDSTTDLAAVLDSAVKRPEQVAPAGAPAVDRVPGAWSAQR